MKVAVITRHAITNYGSLLQTLATQSVINNMGHECVIIDYIRDDEHYTKYEHTHLKHKQKWNKNIIRKAIYLALRQPECVASGRRFECEQKKLLNLSRRYKTKNELLFAKPLADVYMTGSDQVWGLVSSGLYDDVYFLSFTDESDKRVSYAASFGKSEITNEIREYYKKWLIRYDCISVREDSALKIIQEMGISAYQVLDPTLLLGENYWKQYMEPIKHNKYILVYQLHDDNTIGNYASKIAELTHLPIIRISTSFHHVLRKGEFIWCPSIGKFLSYIKNAEYMITDSFHGTAFAINFNISFVETLPSNFTGTRNISLLNMIGLADRLLDDVNNTDLMFTRIDYIRVNQILEEKRKESFGILKTMLEEAAR